MKRITAVMAAHVDAGKTTLSEALLFQAGEIRKAGRVDNGDCFLDNDSRERSRGITIFSKQAVLRTGSAEFTLLDTPGHTDFSAETERAFSVADCAILVISGTDGVQPHTETLWELLKRFEVPVFAFVNKMDISHKSNGEILLELHKLSPNFVEYSDNFAETAAEYDEACMNALLDTGEVPRELAQFAILSRNIFPVVFGSALKNIGVSDFLEILENYSAPKITYDGFGALVYKISTDPNGVRLTHMKILGGELKNRTVIDGEKVTQIRIYSGAKYTTVDAAETGQVVAVTGLSKTFAGQGIGKAEGNFSTIYAPLSYKLILPKETDPREFYLKLKKLEDEEPSLNFSWLGGEIHVRIMGQVQLEILQNVIAERFDILAEFGEGAIAYRETIADTVEGVGHFEPLRHYAEVHLLLEPLPRGSGIEFARDCRDLDENWQRLILSNLRERQHIGVLTGSPVTDVKITLKAGRAHPKHTEGGDFREAAWRAVRQGLASAKSVLLEPFYRFKLEIPQDAVGRAMTDLTRMGAEFPQPNAIGKNALIEGRCPVAEMQSYSAEVTSYTHGTGRLSTVVEGYFPCHNAEEVIEKIGYNFQSDVENTADSVFCSHGAGYLVKWDEVPRKAHLPSVLGKTREGSGTVSQSEISSYKRRAATDKELMEIFERTYGKINRSERTAMRRDKPLEKNYKSHEPRGGEEYLLVDGYNIIFSWDELAELARENLDLARTRLINLMCNYQGFKRCNLILVFDAYKVKSPREVEKYGDVAVVYTKHAETADNFIERTAHKLSKENRVRVATSDGTEQVIILGQGAFRVSAREFKLEVDEVMETIRKVLEEM